MASIHPKKRYSDTTLFPHHQEHFMDIRVKKEDAARNMEISRQADLESTIKTL